MRSRVADGFRHGIERAGLSDSPTEDFFGLGSAPSASEPALKLAPSSVMLKTGWGWSGRLGPVRWLGPLDGEGETTLRLGGRIPGQPRIIGGGKFNVGIHYTFD